MAKLEAGCRFQRVRERVPQVQDRAPPCLLERVCQADGRLEGRAGSHHLFVAELPQGPPGEEPGLDHLRHAGAPLLVRQRLQELRVDQNLLGIVESADEILARVQIDAGLAADCCVHLPDERCRPRDPTHTSLVRRRNKAGDVRRRPTAVSDQRVASVELEGLPEPPGDLDPLGSLARRDRMRPAPEVERMETEDALVCDQGIGAHADCGRGIDERDREPGKEDVLQVSRTRVGHVGVDGRALLVEPAKCAFLPGERPVCTANALPGCPRVDLKPHRQGAAGQQLASRLREDRPAPERDDARLRIS